VKIERLLQLQKLSCRSGSKFAAKSGAISEKVTAFRPEMVHEKYKQPCPRCGTKIQRIRYAANETIIAPHARREANCSRTAFTICHEDWPKTLKNSKPSKQTRKMIRQEVGSGRAHTTTLLISPHLIRDL
jgi:hypothetical protein